jgi:hypothetical protein
MLLTFGRSNAVLVVRGWFGWPKAASPRFSRHFPGLAGAGVALMVLRMNPAEHGKATDTCMTGAIEQTLRMVGANGIWQS